MTGVTSECGNRVKAIGIGYFGVAEQTALGDGIFGPFHLIFPRKNKGSGQNR